MKIENHHFIAHASRSCSIGLGLTKLPTWSASNCALRPGEVASLSVPHDLWDQLPHVLDMQIRNARASRELHRPNELRRRLITTHLGRFREESGDVGRGEGNVRYFQVVQSAALGSLREGKTPQDVPPLSTIYGQILERGTLLQQVLHKALRDLPDGMLAYQAQLLHSFERDSRPDTPNLIFRILESVYALEVSGEERWATLRVERSLEQGAVCDGNGKRLHGVKVGEVMWKGRDAILERTRFIEAAVQAELSEWGN
jgi:hypothetical protein